MKSPPMSYRVSHSVLSVILVATFVSLFFFLYVSNVEREIVQIQMGRIVTAFIKPVQLMASPKQLSDIQQAIKAVKITHEDDVDGKIANSNSQLMRTSAIVFGCINGVGLVAIGVMWKLWHRFDVWHLIKTNLLMIAIVAFVYFMFVTFVVRAFVLIDSNYVRAIVLDSVSKEQQRRGIHPRGDLTNNILIS